MSANKGATLFVNRLHWTVSGGCLRRYFEKFGKVLYADVHIDRKTGLHKGIGWVRMSTVDDAQAALDYKRHTIEGYDASVRPHVKRDMTADLTQLDATKDLVQPPATDTEPSHMTATSSS